MDDVIDMENPENHTLVPLWQTLIAACGDAIGLSRDIASRLQQGAAARELESLLRREAQLAHQLQAGIGRLGQQKPDPESGVYRTRLLGQMRDLLDLEQQNHRLLSRRGVKLTGASPYRYSPRRT